MLHFNTVIGLNKITDFSTFVNLSEFFSIVYEKLNTCSFLIKRTINSIYFIAEFNFPLLLLGKLEIPTITDSTQVSTRGKRGASKCLFKIRLHNSAGHYMSEEQIRKVLSLITHFQSKQKTFAK